MHISSSFDSGNIEVVEANADGTAKLQIRKDPGPDGFFQWFHFRVATEAGLALSLAIENAGQASYTKGWDGYRVCASYDRETWFRVDTAYEDGVLTISHTPACDSVFYAYFAPYSRERHHDLIARCQTDPRVRLSVLGQTLDGQDMDMLTIGEASSGKRPVWMIARQHPGETMAEYWMEGMLSRLLDPADPVSRALLDRATFYVVPNMNPDGSLRGHLRTNAKGVNLNREWATPTMENSPEVVLVDQEMRKTGCDFFLDVHGDEGLPYNFIAGADSIPNVEQRQIDLRIAFEAALRQANPDFQSEHGYPKAPPGKSNVTMASAHVATVHKCLAMTLEMPFKDNANAPDPEYGWSPARCRKLGHSCLDGLYAVIDALR